LETTVPIALEPISGACGAVASGVDLRHELSSAALEEIENALDRHLVLIWPGQPLTAPEQAAFTRRLGPPSPVPFIQPTADHRDVVAIARRAEEPPRFNPAGGWHSDFSFLPEPPSYTVLQAVDVPPFGGDTIWANQYLAYNALSPPMQALLAPLGAVHSAARAFAPSMQAAFDALAEANVVTGPEAFDQEVHPVCVVHPGTGRPSLYVNREYTIGLDGLASQEAQPLLDFLAQHSTRAEFTCRWRWSRGDVVVWDNRCLQHMAMPDYRGHARRMLRTTVNGSRPVRFVESAAAVGAAGEQPR
jgi:alpha-ketoglutarate-dependent taurine dioxygenase